MHRLSYESVVDLMVSSLAENRRSRIERHAAYVALAHAILADESPEYRELAEFDAFVTLSNVAA